MGLPGPASCLAAKWLQPRLLPARPVERVGDGREAGQPREPSELQRLGTGVCGKGGRGVGREQERQLRSGCCLLAAGRGPAAAAWPCLLLQQDLAGWEQLPARL